MEDPGLSAAFFGQLHILQFFIRIYFCDGIVFYSFYLTSQSLEGHLPSDNHCFSVVLNPFTRWLHMLTHEVIMFACIWQSQPSVEYTVFHNH